MRHHSTARGHLFILLGAALSLGLLVNACGTDEEPGPSVEDPVDAAGDVADGIGDEPDGSVDGPETSGDGSGDASTDDPDDVPVEEEAEPIGSATGNLIAIDHATALATVQANLIEHIDGLEDALAFLEDSDSVENMVDVLFGGDDEDEGGDEEPGEVEPEPEEEGIEIDLSELRDDLVEFIVDEIMVEETSTVSEDGLTLSYQIDPAQFCDDEPDGEETDEAKTERIEDEAECAGRMTQNPIRIDVTSDGEGRMNLSIRAGNNAVEAIMLQVHDDMISVSPVLSNIQDLLQAFVDPEDFTLPATMEGSFACEIRENVPLEYAARCAIPEAINVVPDADQDPFSLQMDQADAPGGILIDGNGATISGALDLANISASMPWQIVVDMFWDDEGYSEWVCEPNAGGGEDCWDKWIDPPESPEVEGAIILAVPAVSGALDYGASDDVFKISGGTLGGSSTTVKVEADTIVSFDLNPEAGYELGVDVSGYGEQNMRIEISPSLDAEVTFAWQAVSSVLDDPPSFLLDETLGVRFDGSDKPTLDILSSDDEDKDTQVQVSSGQLTLWSSGMTEDVVIEEGQCITGVDDESLTEEEKDAQHDLFGGLIGATCEP